MPTTKPVAVISSTARDLPDHRKEVMDACHRATCDYVWMETLPASNDDAVAASMKLVDRADVYIGIFAHRYGYVPAGSEISITEMEYERAVKRCIPRLIFFIHDDHPIVKAMVETGPGAEKLDRFKKRIGEERVAAFFKSPENLRSHVLLALPATLKDLQTPEAAAAIPPPHFVQPIPQPPEPYIAYYYALLQTGKIIGRHAELDRLTHWITRSANPMMHVIAIGGMGKSALTWHWFHHCAPHEWPRMKGRIWWSFYESDGHFENFITRSLAYVSGQTEAEVRKQNLRDRCDSLIQILHKEPYLIVLDGLERLLTAYSRMDAPFLADGDIDEKSQNAVLDAQGKPQGFYQMAAGRHALRLAGDPNVGRFLKILCQLRASRILTSSRLFPADLQLPSGQASAGCDYHFLQGLSESDALDLWREYGARGSSDKMLPIFRSFGCHPLVLKVFAGKVANYRRAPGDFDKWHEANPDFKPGGELVQVQSHILQHSLRDLLDTERQTLNIIAGFRMAAGIETLQAVLVNSAPPTSAAPEGADPRVQAPFRSFGELDAALTVLEDRGLLGWDRRANRYDLHPIVRGVVWDLMHREHQHAICEMLRTHLDAIPTKKWREVESLDDLTYAIELYDKLITLGRYDDAEVVFRDRVDDAMFRRLGTARILVSLLERLFPDGTDRRPRLQSIRAQSYTLCSLALAYDLSGLSGKAADLYERAAELECPGDDKCSWLGSIPWTHRKAGKLRTAHATSRHAVLQGKEQKNAIDEAIGWEQVAWMFGLCGDVAARPTPFKREQCRCSKNTTPSVSKAARTPFWPRPRLWLGQAHQARNHADRAWELAAIESQVGDYLRAARLQGIAALRLGEFPLALERLQEALKRVRASDNVAEELAILTALAEFHRQQYDPAKAHEFLDEVWEKCERGPYLLIHADAFNVLAQIERDAGHNAEAIAAATQAYQKAWCDGPPFAYHWGLEAAKKHLQELGAPFPDMPAFDESKYPPMPEVEINPHDDYYVEPEE